ncbi:MAG: murein biosynthesis integral membrane protein MurJ [Desulfobacteraceae bacterium]|nr:murein biosynthesis integral membrane protein MurJ [Desulfobacteraceae bacterium]
MTKKSSTFKQVGFASIIMMASVFASRIIGLAREMAIAFSGGAGGEVDAYQVAFIIPEILNHIVASGFLSVTFIPIFSAYLAKDDEAEGWRIFSIVYNTFGALLLTVTILALWLAPELVALLAPGFEDPALFQQAVTMTRIIIPAQLFFFSGGLFMAVQFTKQRFMIPALAPLIYNLGIIIGGIALGPWLGMEGFAWGVLGGAFAGNFLLQYYGAKKIGMDLKFILGITHPEFIRYLLLTLPLMVGLTMTFSTEILLKYFGSYLAEGSIAALNYGLRIMFILVGLFGQAVGVASYPFMAKLAAQGKTDELNNLLNTTMKFLLLVIPVSVLFMVLRHEIVLILFQRGRFDLEATRLTSQVLPFLLCGTFAFAAQTVVVRGYYATQNTWFPALVGTISVILTLPLFYVLMTVMDARGVALALSLAATAQTLILFELWNRRSRNRAGRSVYRFLLSMVVLSAGIGFLLWKFAALLKNVIDPSTLTGALLVCIITGILFVVMFTLAGTLFRIEEINRFNRKILQKLRR